ncbi:arylsulfotransferase family protein [Enemella evansiae]|uniref:arylsulfotransferase family protein n=1 Tax=Enemella evansiae TaxID=2016499 RepID=UPI0015C61C0B|nr:arylsulfotransferase family protein [Enemella evansiae]
MTTAEGAPVRPPARMKAAPGPAPVSVGVSGTLASVQVATGPRMTPTFDSQIRDYALWCTSGSNQVTVRYSGSGLAIDGSRGSTVDQAYTLVENQALVVRANGGEYWFRCLPRDFPRMNVTSNGTVPDGWYVIDTQDPFTGEAPPQLNLQYAMITDTNGTPVWYIGTTGGYFNTQRENPTQLSWSPQIGPVGLNPGSRFTNYDISSQDLWSVGPARTGYLDPHEYRQLSNGNYAWILTPPEQRDLSAYPSAQGVNSIWECRIQEADASGNALWEWRMGDHVGLEETRNSVAATGTPDSTLMQFGRWDPYHCNAVDEAPTDDPSGRWKAGDLLVSARDLNAVYLIDRRTGELRWKLGGTAPTEPGTAYIKDFRTATGQPAKPFVSQHDARFNEDGTITLFDNNYQAPNWTTGRKTRGVAYQVEPSTGTATETWTWSNDQENPSQFQGSFRRNSATGENVFGWGSLPGGGLTEVDNSGTVKRRIKITGLAGYRATKVPADSFEPWMLRDAAGRPIVECNAPILDKEAEMNGSLGGRTSGLQTDLPSGGCQRLYGEHAIVWSPQTGAFNNKGSIRQQWIAVGGAAGRMGYPTSDEFCGLRDGGCAQRFQGGLIYWQPGAGAQAVWGAIGEKYAQLGWENSQLGYPTSGEFCGLRDGGCAQRFQGGLIYWQPGAGAQTVWGAIGEKYAQLGWENSQLGYPTSGEFCGLRDGGCWQSYQGGAVYWSPASGAHNNLGVIRAEYGRQGWENGRLGYPVTDERCGIAAADGGCVQDYQGGTITWSPPRGAYTTFR